MKHGPDVGPNLNISCIKKSFVAESSTKGKNKIIFNEHDEYSNDTLCICFYGGKDSFDFKHCQNNHMQYPRRKKRWPAYDNLPLSSKGR